MAGTHRRWTGAVVLAAAVVAGCARQGTPPGGTPDTVAPAIIVVRPAAGGEAEDLDESIRIEFNERISERITGGTLQDVVIVSPATGEARVSHGRSSLEVELEGGLQPGLVYAVAVQPMISDLFGNQMPEPFEFVFSTGAEFHETAVAGLVVDRITGDAVAGLSIEALPAGDADTPPGPAYRARTDQDGVYTLRYLPPGAYRITAVQDRDQNGVPDSFELQGIRVFELHATDTVLVNFPVLQPDPTGAVLVEAEVVDSATVLITFDDYLDPDEPLALVAALIESAEDEAPGPAVTGLIHEHRYRALRQAEAAEMVTDTVAADTIVVDSLPSEPGDSLEVPSAPGLFGAGAPRPALPQRGRRGPAGSGAAQRPRGRNVLGLTLPARTAYVQLAGPLTFGEPYHLVVRGAINLAGLESPTDTVLVQRQDPAGPGGGGVGAER